jgi:hypothetical protein
MGGLKRPLMSRRGRIAMGMYCGYFAAAIFLGGYLPYLMFGVPLPLIPICL